MKKLLLILFTALSLVANAQPKQSDMENKKPYTILVLMNATPKWLSLTREQRSEFVEKELTPIFVRVSKTVSVRLFDSEYFHASVSDFMIVTTTNLDDYKLLIELLRDTKVYAAPYFEIKDIIVGQENLFKDFNERFKKEE
ncbi:darcynin family protein [Confluentibacter sediminis]|uniref:darcynin family protein n=1 Tax=Confluentibacter sediminis TaxID=2219045 RepID=UPI000DAE7A8B|nr:darcynin family protein [Confluentibacter sediminis]